MLILASQILTMVNDTLVLDHILALRPQAVPIAEAVLQRQMLCSMRLVSSGWRTASEWGGIIYLPALVTHD